MNAERLHAICLELKQSIESTNIVNKFKQVVSNLQNIVNNPQDSGQQQALTNNLGLLYEVLQDFSTDYYSPAWRQSLDELGGSHILGKQLEEEIRNILEKNQITPATAFQEIQKLFQELQQFKGAVDGVVTAFDQLKIGSEKLEPGECEVGILIPRSAVHNNVQEFGKELQDINFILGTFSELSSGNRETFKINTISSSDLMVFLAAIPPVAACIAYAAEKIINLYKTLLEIKKLKGELKKQGLAEEEMKGINDHADTVMSKGVEELTIKIVEEYYVGNDPQRKNELSNAVSIALNKLANRIDQGFNVEVRAEPTNKSEDKGTASEDAQKNKEYIDRVLSVSKTLRFMKHAGPRILHLPEKTIKSN